MTTKTQTAEALKYYESQVALSKAISEVNSSRGLPNEMSKPYTQGEARAQVEAVHQFINERKKAIAALEDALLDVDLNNRIGYLDDYLAAL